MSNIYLTQKVRDKHRINWHEEYILGLVAHQRGMSVSPLLTVAREVMTQATTHKYLTQLIDKKYLKHDLRADKRIKVVKLTDKGEKYIREIANVSVVPSLAVS